MFVIGAEYNLLKPNGDLSIFQAKCVGINRGKKRIRFRYRDAEYEFYLSKMGDGSEVAETYGKIEYNAIYSRNQIRGYR